MEAGTVAPAQLGEEVAFLQLENAFLLKFLQRVWPEGLHSSPRFAPGGCSTLPFAPGEADGAEAALCGGAPLLLAEKLELCAVEANATRNEIEQVQLESDLEHACTLAAIADCRHHQQPQTAKDINALLALLGLPAPASTPFNAESSAAAQPPASLDTAAGQASSTGARPVAGLQLPSAKQLAKGDLHGGRLEQYMQDILDRHQASAARLQMRNGMLKAQLAKVNSQLSAKAEVGESLRKVDYDVLRIEHSRAEAGLAAASADAIALKAQVAKAQQHLADQWAALSAAEAGAASVQKQAELRRGQLAQLQAEAAKVQRECEVLERECERLRAQRGQQQPRESKGAGAGTGDPDFEAGSTGAATVMDYMRVKHACAEASKKIRDWQRKIEVQAGRRSRAATQH